MLATTNRVKSVDRALMRPGRLDIKISIPNPSENARVAALRVCSRDVPMDDDVNLLAIASRANLLTGAELANVVREAALIALRENICAKSVCTAPHGGGTCGNDSVISEDRHKTMGRNGYQELFSVSKRWNNIANIIYFFFLNMNNRVDFTNYT